MNSISDSDDDQLRFIEFIDEWHRNKEKIPRHTPKFYEKLASTLRNSSLTSCAYFGFGDYAVLQILAAEQVRRASETGQTKEEAFPFSIHCQIELPYPEWGIYEPFFTRGIIKNPSIFINDWSEENTVAGFLKIRRSTTQIVFSSSPQWLGFAADSDTINDGYLIYTVGNRTIEAF